MTKWDKGVDKSPKVCHTINMEEGKTPKTNKTKPTMNNFKTLAVTALTAITTIIPTAVEAKNVDRAHMNLAQAVRATGVVLKVNPAACNERDAYGWYWAGNNEMVICQERAIRTGVETYWTAEDLDTLRHEAQHLVQDCMDGRKDGRLDAVYTNPLNLAEKVLGQGGIQNVLETYADAPDHIKVMELEAFSVAALNDPMEQVRDIKNYCF